MNAMNLLRVVNQIQGRLLPNRAAHNMARLFLTPRNPPLKDWELEVEASCQRVPFSAELTAAVWGRGDKKVLLMHGWESRATHMYSLVEPLINNGFQVVVIDAPRHGQSGGDKTNLAAFAKAIVAAEVEFGPFVAAVGHSLGAAALAYAIELGVKVNCCVLISSPANILDLLQGFARYVGLPAKAQSLFIKQIERVTGVAASELQIGRLLAKKNIKTLLVHSQDDLEISIEALNTIQRALPDAKTHIAENLGHRKIIRDGEISNLVGQFVNQYHQSMAG